MLTEYLLPIVEQFSPTEKFMLWYQHDGAPPHYSRAVQQLLNEKFKNQWIGRGGPIEWPPRSPDLNPLDFFLWGYIKALVHKKTTENAC